MKTNFVVCTITLLAMILFSSCQKQKREIEMLNSSKDSIIQVVSEREQVIVDYIASFNDIQERLDSIKAAQKILDVQLSGSDVEIRKANKDEIINDIMLINNLIEDNKKTISALRSRLKSSNLKSTELQTMIDNMSRQIEEKDAEIVTLNSKVEKLEINIASLGIKVDSLSRVGEEKSATIKKHVDAMNVAYYCFGTLDELVANNIVEKSGGFLGLGRSVKMKEDFNQDYFMKVDIRDFKEILLMSKKAELITTHPNGSYRFTNADDKVEYLYIDKPDEFWKASKYLVVLVDVK